MSRKLRAALATTGLVAAVVITAGVLPSAAHPAG
jgi:hypothetical protein